MHTRTISMLLGALLSTGVMMAQAPDQAQPSTGNQATQNEHARHGANPDRMAQHLGKKLGLSNDQVAQIKPVLEERAQKMQALRADTSLSGQDRRAKAQEIVQDSNNRLEAVMNDTQKQQFEQLLQQRRVRHNNSQPQVQ